MTDLYTLKLDQIWQDAEQYEAFLSKENTVVKAGPGSGKTTVLTLKIMNLLNEKIKAPRGLACITYSNEAVNEFTSRLKHMGFQKRMNVTLSTVHSFCISEIIVPFADLYNKNISVPLNIISVGDKTQLFQNILNELEIEKSQLNLIDMDKERSMSIGNESEVIIESYDIAKTVALEYEKRLRDLEQVDFVEIIKVASQLIEEQDYVRKCLEAKFPWILIDEYQDLGKPLHEMVLTLIQKTNIKFFVVGDLDQSIYGFQGGHPEFLKEIYESERIKSIELTTNYRSNQEIIDISTIALNLDDREYKAGTRHGEKADIHFITCEDEMDEQYEYIVNNIIPECLNENIPLEEICVLSKNWFQLEELSRLMDNYSIPYYFAKQEFLKSHIILWLKDCASWISDSSTVAFADLLNFWVNIIPDPTEDNKVNESKRLFYTLKQSEQYNGDLHKWVGFILDRLSIKKHAKQISKYQDEIEAIDKFYEITTTRELKDYDIIRFSQLGKPNDQITLSTRHSAKGLEFEVVIILGLEEGNFPYYENVNNESKLNEERRVFYVSLTRAKRVCYLLRSKRITYNTRYGPWTRNKGSSMFWNELLEAKNIKKDIKKD